MSRRSDSVVDAFDARCVLMFDVTTHTLRSDPELRLCEGLRLIEATHAAVARLAPAALETFESHVLPQMRTILMERFGVPDLPSSTVN
jgi:hypothetical protein